MRSSATWSTRSARRGISITRPRRSAAATALKTRLSFTRWWRPSAPRPQCSSAVRRTPSTNCSSTSSATHQSWRRGSRGSNPWIIRPTARSWRMRATSFAPPTPWRRSAARLTARARAAAPDRVGTGSRGAFFWGRKVLRGRGPSASAAIKVPSRRLAHRRGLFLRCDSRLAPAQSIAEALKGKSAGRRLRISRQLPDFITPSVSAVSTSASALSQSSVSCPGSKPRRSAR
jgi:hypothetical protein